MQIPVYIIYELLIRLQELNPGVGDYIQNKRDANGVLVRTSTGSINLPEDLLFRQFNDPASISQFELLNLLESFRLSFADGGI